MAIVAQPIIAILAGEASGDTIGAALIEALKLRFPTARFTGIAGPKMQALGCDSLIPIETLSVMGLWEVLKHLRSLLRARKKVLKLLQSLHPDIVIGIDAPDFNLGIEAKTKSWGIPTWHYVSPSVWAWREKRIHKIKEATDGVLCLLPFEPEYYQKIDHPAQFVGHPIIESISHVPNKLSARKLLDITPTQLVVAILPGSREQELTRMMPVFLETVTKLKARYPHLKTVLPVAGEHLKTTLSRYQFECDRLHIEMTSCASLTVLSAADVALCTSGTAVLESVLLKTPTVMAYCLSAISYYLAKHMVHCAYYSLPNLILNQGWIPEFIQEAATSDALVDAVVGKIKSLQNNDDDYANFLKQVDQLKQCLAPPERDAAAEVLSPFIVPKLRSLSR